MVFHMLLRACETLWSAREMASVTLSAERERRTENVFIALSSKMIRMMQDLNMIL